MRGRHLLGLDELSSEELKDVLGLAVAVKEDPERYRNALSGKMLAMIFQKPSTRTRVSFQVGIHQLGGTALVLGQNDLQLGRGETLADTARVLSRYVDAIMARVFAHSDLVELARYAQVPVINGLSDLLHPCQAICDYLTIEERFGSLQGVKVVYLGDGNNVAHSLAYGAARLGVDLVLVTPPGRYQPNPEVLDRARTWATETGATIEVSHDAATAVRGARVIYTDVWTSMGQEAENKQRLKDLRDYQVTLELFDQAKNDAVFMHCLPAHRGEEVVAEVADHPRSVIFDQAENRLHAQKALLLRLLG